MEKKNKQSIGKILRGIIVGFSGQKTVKVEVETKKRHPIYGKIIMSHKRYLVHTEQTEGLAVGQEVKIEESRPISKQKKFILVNKDN